MGPKRKTKSSTSAHKGNLGIQPIVDLDPLNFFLKKELQIQIQEKTEESILPTGNFLIY